MILVAQCREFSDPTLEHEQDCIRRRAPEGLALKFCTVFDDQVVFDDPHLLDGITRVIIGGSAAISLAPGHKNNDYTKASIITERLKPFILNLIRLKVPTLGICLGNQLLAQACGATVVFDHHRSESGVYDVTVHDSAHRIFRDVPETFAAILGHHDSPDIVPNGSVVLASNPQGPQAVEYRPGIIGTTFHPELNKADHEFRMNLFPDYREEADPNAQSHHAINHAVQVLRNFLA
ncbi:MAG TPA: type 1 glutamine amidotransferase [Candidatus Saccharimonadales bacterium]|nr:type 1 glutamine amidotransferase [Candidatus Saccharimonadales bacterium]